MIEKDYLRGLDIDTLRDIQTSVLKAQFKNPNIDKEGSFLHFFHNNLHKFISEPYREDVSTEIIILEESPQGYRIKDKIVYTCRSSGGMIQPIVRWAPDKDEFLSVTSVKMSVTYPDSHEKGGQSVELKPDGEPKIDANTALQYSLDAYKSVDGLVVTIDSEYVMEKGRLQSWEMAHPTKNFDLTVKFPRDSQIQYKPLFQARPISATQEEGFLRLKFDTWLLPRSGVAWVVSSKP